MNATPCMTTTVVTVPSTTRLDAAIELMESHGVHHLPVVDGDRPVGMLSDRDVLLAVGWLGEDQRQSGFSAAEGVAGPRFVAEIMSQPVLAVSREATVEGLAAAMVTHKINALPVVDDGRLIGLVTTTDLLQQVARPDHALWQGTGDHRVFDVATPHVLTARPKASLDYIIGLFTARRIRHVPVVAGDALLGIVADRDVRRAVGESLIRDAQAQAAGAFYVGPQTALDVMTHPVHTVDANASMFEAITLFMTHAIYSLPVMDRERLVGIVTQSDVLRWIAGDAGSATVV